MAITDNAFTMAELEAAASANPNLITEISSFAEKAGGYFAPTADAKSLYETNLSTRVKGELTSQHATEVEKKVKEITGIDKASADEKWTDYYQRALRTKTDSEKALDAKIKTLESKSDITAAEREQLVNLQALVANKDTEITSLKDTHQNETTRLKAETKIYSEISKVHSKLKKDALLQDAIGIVSNNVLSEMIASAKFDNGKMVFYGSDGKVLSNADASFMTAEQLYALKMDKYIDKGRTGAGAGSEPDDHGSDNAGGIKTQVELSRDLGKRGMISGTPEFTKEFERLGGNKLPLR